MKKRFAETLNEINQAPYLIPNSIPKGTIVEVIREVKHKDFWSGTGYLIFWEDVAYADVVDGSRLKFIEDTKPVTMSEILEAVDVMKSLPKVPYKVKINREWLKEQIDNGVIREEDFSPDGPNRLAGIPMEVTDDVKDYEFIYER